MRKIRILLVDDSCILRHSAAELLQGAPDLEIVGEAADEREAAALAVKLQPELVLIGLSAPQAIGSLLRRLSLFCPGASALVFSLFDGRLSGPTPAWSRRDVYRLTLMDLGSLIPAVRTVAAVRSRGEPMAHSSPESRQPVVAAMAGRGTTPRRTAHVRSVFDARG